MEKIFNAASIFAGIAGGILAFLFGQFDMILWALIALIVLDYITGIIKAVHNKKLSSEISFDGLMKKITILVIVALANIIQSIIGSDTAIREIVIMFYIANEGISILENVAAVSTKMPPKIKDILFQLRGEQN